MSKISFDKRMGQIEAIVSRLENSDSNLEESLEAYARGIALIRDAQEILEKAEQRIIELSDDARKDKTGDTPASENVGK